MILFGQGFDVRPLEKRDHVVSGDGKEIVPVSGPAHAGDQPHAQQIPPEPDRGVHVGGGHGQVMDSRVAHRSPSLNQSLSFSQSLSLSKVHRPAESLKRP